MDFRSKLVILSGLLQSFAALRIVIHLRVVRPRDKTMKCMYSLLFAQIEWISKQILNLNSKICISMARLNIIYSVYLFVCICAYNLLVFIFYTSTILSSFTFNFFCLCFSTKFKASYRYIDWLIEVFVDQFLCIHYIVISFGNRAHCGGTTLLSKNYGSTKAKIYEKMLFPFFVRSLKPKKIGTVKMKRENLPSITDPMKYGFWKI